MDKIAEAFSGIVDIQKYLVGMGRPGESLGERICKDAEVKKALDSGNTAVINLTAMEMKTAITSTGTQNDPLVMPYRPAIDPGTRRRVRVRDLLPVFPTLNGAIEYPVKTGATNNAGSQDRENTAFGESAYTFGLTFQACEAIGHHVPVSKQVMEDSGTFDAFIRQELLSGLQTEVEDQLLNGTGSNSELSGMLAGATAYTLRSPNLTAEVDIIRDAIKQIQVADYNPNAIILNPADWYDIDTADGDPRLMDSPKLWGLPVVPCNAIASGTFLIGDFQRAAILFDRQQPTVEISRYHSSNMTSGMLEILATERLSLVVANATALVKGSL